jgi:hypothetical protein
VGKGGGVHTAITTDHVSRGEFLNDVQAVFAFGTHERDIKVKPKRFIFLRQRETHHREDSDDSARGLGIETQRKTEDVLAHQRLSVEPKGL